MVERPIKVTYDALKMIQTIITHACPRCGSDQLVRNGHDYKGVQKFRCNSCSFRPKRR